MPDRPNTTPQWYSGEVAIEFRKLQLPVNYYDLILKEDHLLIPRLDCVNWS